jgi:hypothetical protein
MSDHLTPAQRRALAYDIAMMAAYERRAWAAENIGAQVVPNTSHVPMPEHGPVDPSGSQGPEITDEERPAPIRYEYGTPRYNVAPGVESTSPLTPGDLAELPALPSAPGWYIAREGAWLPTDGLTYREVAPAIRVLGMGR